MDKYNGKYDNLIRQLAYVTGVSVEDIISNPKLETFLDNCELYEQKTGYPLFSDIYAKDPNSLQKYLYTGHDFEAIHNSQVSESYQPGSVTYADITDNEENWFAGLVSLDPGETYVYDELYLTDDELPVFLGLCAFKKYGDNAFSQTLKPEEPLNVYYILTNNFPWYIPRDSYDVKNFLISNSVCDNYSDEALDELSEAVFPFFSAREAVDCEFENIAFPGANNYYMHITNGDTNVNLEYDYDNSRWRLVLKDGHIDNGEVNVYTSDKLKWYEMATGYSFSDNGYNYDELRTRQWDIDTSSYLNHEFNVNGIDFKSNNLPMGVNADEYFNNREFSITYNGYTLPLSDVAYSDGSDILRNLVESDDVSTKDFGFAFSLRMDSTNNSQNSIGLPLYKNSKGAKAFYKTELTLSNGDTVEVILNDENIKYFNADGSLNTSTDSSGKSYIIINGEKSYVDTNTRYHILIDDNNNPILCNINGVNLRSDDYFLSYESNPELAGYKDIEVHTDDNGNILYYRLYFNNGEYEDYYISDSDSVNVPSFISDMENTRAYNDNFLFDLFVDAYGDDAYIDIRTVYNLDDNNTINGGYKVIVTIGTNEYELSPDEADKLVSGDLNVNDVIKNHQMVSPTSSDTNRLTVDNTYVDQKFFTSCINYSDEQNYNRIIDSLLSVLEGEDALKGYTSYNSSINSIENVLEMKIDSSDKCCEIFKNVGKQCKNLSHQIDYSIKLLTAYDDDMKKYLDNMIKNFFDETNIGYAMQQNGVSIDTDKFISKDNSKDNEIDLNSSDVNKIKEKMNKFFEEQSKIIDSNIKIEEAMLNGKIVLNAQDVIQLGLHDILSYDKIHDYSTGKDLYVIPFTDVAEELGIDYNSSDTALNDWASNELDNYNNRSGGNENVQMSSNELYASKYLTLVSTMAYADSVMSDIGHMKKFQTITSKYANDVILNPAYYENLTNIRNGTIPSCNLFSYEEQALLMMKGALTTDDINEVNDELNIGYLGAAEYVDSELDTISRGLLDSTMSVSKLVGNEVVKDLCSEISYYIDKDGKPHNGEMRSMFNERVGYVEATNMVKKLLSDNKIDIGEFLAGIGDSFFDGFVDTFNSIGYMWSPETKSSDWAKSYLIKLLDQKDDVQLDTMHLNGDISTEEYLLRKRIQNCDIDTDTYKWARKASDAIGGTVAEIAMDAVAAVAANTGIGAPVAMLVAAAKALSKGGKEANSFYESGHSTAESIIYGGIYAASSFAIKNWKKLTGAEKWSSPKVVVDNQTQSAGSTAFGVNKGRRFIGFKDKVFEKAKDKGSEIIKNQFLDVDDAKQGAVMALYALVTGINDIDYYFDHLSDLGMLKFADNLEKVGDYVSDYDYADAVGQTAYDATKNAAKVARSTFGFNLDPKDEKDKK